MTKSKLAVAVVVLASIFPGVDRSQARESRGTAEKKAPAPRVLPTDTDNDGMPDVWEDDNGLDPYDPADAWFDADTDNVYNLFEYQLGYEAYSPFDPLVVTVGASGANYTNVETALNSVIDGVAIRIAAGTYECNYTSFSPRVVMLQGGWNSDFTERDLEKYSTILDGGMSDEIIRISFFRDESTIIVDGLHLIRGAGYFGALSLIAEGTSIVKTSVVDCSFVESTCSAGIITLISWNSSQADRTIANTLIAGNIGTGIMGQVTGGAQARWRILNSTIAENQDPESSVYGVRSFTLDTGVIDVDIYNSIIWGNDTADIYIGSLQSDALIFSSDYSDIGSVDAYGDAVYDSGVHDIDSDPRYVDEGDYHLSSKSPCLGKGAAGLGPVTDLDGRARSRLEPGTVDIGCYEYYRPTPVPLRQAAIGDYNGDGTSDVALFRPSAGLWLVRGVTKTWFGASTDEVVPRDYSGDGTWDLAVFRPSNGKWLVRGVTGAFYGVSTDVPVPADYDGDTTADIALFRPSIGKWLVRGGFQVYYGFASDTVVPGDYDGDGTDDVAIFRPGLGKWLVYGGPSAYYGAATDLLVPQDYTGDGTCNFAVWRPSRGRWMVMDGPSTYWGISSDTVQPADYDGDGTVDFAVFRSSAGKWLIRGVTAPYYGSSTDLPVTNP